MKVSNLLASLAFPLGLLAVASCSSDDVLTSPVQPTGEQQHILFGVESSGHTRTRGATRGAPIEYPDSSIGVFIYTYNPALSSSWSATMKPNFAYNDEVFQLYEERDDDRIIWMTSPSYLMPPVGNKRQQFAYYPYHDDELGTAPNITIPKLEDLPIGYPRFDFYVLDDVVKQQDLLVGQSEEVTQKPIDGEPTKPRTDTTTISMHHMLSGVRFCVSTQNVQLGKIKSISLENVKYKGTYVFNSPNWAVVQNDTHSFSLDINYSIPATTAASTDPTKWRDDLINPDDGVFLMMPQTTPAASQLHIVYTDLFGVDFDMYCDMKDLIWERGKIYTYALSISERKIIQVTGYNIVDWDMGGDYTGEVTDGNVIMIQGTINDWDSWTVDADGNVIQ